MSRRSAATAFATYCSAAPSGPQPAMSPYRSRPIFPPRPRSGSPSLNSMAISFIHAADIHLDSPLRGLERYENAPVERIRGATRRAFERMIDLALERRVDFVLIAGDLY